MSSILDKANKHFRITYSGQICRMHFSRDWAPPRSIKCEPNFKIWIVKRKRNNAATYKLLRNLFIWSSLSSNIMFILWMNSEFFYLSNLASSRIKRIYRQLLFKYNFPGGRIVVTYGTGELLIRSARHDDSLPTYSCLTIHALTQERKRSQAARLTVIGKWFFSANYSSILQVCER